MGAVRSAARTRRIRRTDGPPDNLGSAAESAIAKAEESWRERRLDAVAGILPDDVSGAVQGGRREAGAVQ